MKSGYVIRLMRHLTLLIFPCIEFVCYSVCLCCVYSLPWQCYCQVGHYAGHITTGYPIFHIHQSFSVLYLNPLRELRIIPVISMCTFLNMPLSIDFFLFLLLLFFLSSQVSLAYQYSLTSLLETSFFSPFTRYLG